MKTIAIILLSIASIGFYMDDRELFKFANDQKSRVELLEKDVANLQKHSNVPEETIPGEKK